MNGRAEIGVACETQAILGEGPVWDAGRDCLWFVDIKAKLLHRFDPATRTHAQWPAPDQIGWVLPAEDGSLVAGVLHSLYRFAPEAGAFEHLADVPGEPAGNRLNDACTDPWGRIWFGSMDDAEAASTGRFYRYDRGEIRPAGPNGICITNGPAISPDGSRIYFVDTLARLIHAAPLSPSGTVGEPELTFPIAAETGHPDGPMVDAENHLWIGLFGGHAIERYDPDGRRVARIELPVSNCTKGAFGGPDLATLYLTTAAKGLDADARAHEPHAGDLLSAIPGSRGAATPLAKLG